MLRQIGERVRQARTEKHMSQAQLAEVLRVSAPYISNIEQGKQAMSVVTLSGICEVLDVSADWILRSNTPEVRRITDEEISMIMEDCSLAERNALLKLLQDMKDVLRSMNDER